MKKLKKFIVITGCVGIGAFTISSIINIIKTKKSREEDSYPTPKKKVDNEDEWQLKGMDSPKFKELSEALTHEFEDNDVLKNAIKYDINEEG